jgi:hypothetical protein
MIRLDVFETRSELEEIKKKVGRELRERDDILRRQLLQARKDAGILQREVAFRFGRDQSFIAKLEGVIRRITFAETERLAAIYGKRLAEFWKDIPTVKRYRTGPLPSRPT